MGRAAWARPRVLEGGFRVSVWPEMPFEASRALSAQSRAMTQCVTFRENCHEVVTECVLPPPYQNHFSFKGGLREWPNREEIRLVDGR